MNKHQALKPLQNIFKLCQPSKRHMARTFPYLKAQKNQDDWVIRWKGKVILESQPWSTLSQINEAFIVGAGPSIRKQDLSRLNNKPVILLNGAISLYQVGAVKEVAAVVVEDARHMYINAHNYARLPKHIPFVLSLEAIHGFLYIAGDDALNGRSVYVLDNLQKPYGAPKQGLAAFSDTPWAVTSNNVGFSKDLSKGFFICGTVMYAGIQVAHQMGAKALYLVGFDMSNLPRFYDAAKGGAWTGLEEGLTRVIEGVSLAQTVVEQTGGKIYNCSPSSNIPRDILPYTDILDHPEPSL